VKCVQIAHFRLDLYLFSVAFKVDIAYEGKALQVCTGVRAAKM